MRARRIRWLAPALAVTLVATACSTDDDPANSTTSSNDLEEVSSSAGEDIPVEPGHAAVARPDSDGEETEFAGEVAVDDYNPESQTATIAAPDGAVDLRQGDVIALTPNDNLPDGALFMVSEDAEATPGGTQVATEEATIADLLGDAEVSLRGEVENIEVTPLLDGVTEHPDGDFEPPEVPSGDVESADDLIPEGAESGTDEDADSDSDAESSGSGSGEVGSDDADAESDEDGSESGTSEDEDGEAAEEDAETLEAEAGTEEDADTEDGRSEDESDDDEAATEDEDDAESDDDSAEDDAAGDETSEDESETLETRDGEVQEDSQGPAREEDGRLSVPSPAEHSLVRPQARHEWQTLALELDVPLPDWVEPTDNHEPTLKGWVEYTPEMLFEYQKRSWINFLPQRATIGIGGAYDYGWSVHGRIQGTYREEKVPFAQVRFDRTLSAAGFPIPVKAELILYYTITADGNITIDVDGRTVGSWAAAAVYERSSGWDTINEVLQNSADYYDINGAANLLAGVGLEAEVSIFGAAGLGAEFNPYLRADIAAEIAENIAGYDVGLYGGLDLRVWLFLTLRIFGITLLDLNTDIVRLHREWVLWEGADVVELNAAA